MQHRLFRVTAFTLRELFYMVIFAAQRDPNWPQFSHTFATFVKATGTGDSVDGYQVESHTISWLPVTLAIAVFRREPEPGINLDLQSSLRWALGVHARISAWGPFQIDRDLFDRAVHQEQRLQKGTIGYKVIDGCFRPHTASNCIHAVSDIDLDHGLLNTGTQRGEGASALVALHFKRRIIDPAAIHEWVAERLGLQNYPIVRRALAPEALYRQVALPQRLLMSIHSLMCTSSSYLHRQTLLLKNALYRHFESSEHGELAAARVHPETPASMAGAIRSSTFGQPPLIPSNPAVFRTSSGG